MKELLDKISSYNIFNYLLPGILFSVLLERLTSYSFIQSNLFMGAFVFYFVGLVVSRVGSLIIEPFLKKIRFIKFADYGDYIAATKNDNKIELLSESNNMYRTLISVFLLLIIFRTYEWFSLIYSVLNSIAPPLLTILLLTMFLFSYRKQTTYIGMRVDSSKPKSTVMSQSSDR